MHSLQWLKLNTFQAERDWRVCSRQAQLPGTVEQRPHFRLSLIAEFCPPVQVLRLASWLRDMHLQNTYSKHAMLCSGFGSGNGLPCMQSLKKELAVGDQSRSPAVLCSDQGKDIKQASTLSLIFQPTVSAMWEQVAMLLWRQPEMTATRRSIITNVPDKL